MKSGKHYLFKKGNKYRLKKGNEYRFKKGNKYRFRNGNKPTFLFGENHPNWKGGLKSIDERIRTSNSGKEWKKLVLQRDYSLCVICGSDSQIEVDHIIPLRDIIEKIKFEMGVVNLYENVLRDNLFNDLSNGRTLCKACHRKTETWGTNGLRNRRYRKPTTTDSHE